MAWSAVFVFLLVSLYKVFEDGSHTAHPFFTLGRIVFQWRVQWVTLRLQIIPTQFILKEKKTSLFRVCCDMRSAIYTNYETHGALSFLTLVPEYLEWPAVP